MHNGIDVSAQLEYIFYKQNKSSPNIATELHCDKFTIQHFSLQWKYSRNFTGFFLESKDRKNLALMDVYVDQVNAWRFTDFFLESKDRQNIAFTDLYINKVNAWGLKNCAATWHNNTLMNY